MPSTAYTNRCPSCASPIPADRLMCRGHWRLVPADVQRRVWATWRRLNGSARDGGHQARASALTDYNRARNDAIEAVRATQQPKAPEGTDGQQQP